jgi:hypothetical protein
MLPAPRLLLFRGAVLVLWLGAALAPMAGGHAAPSPRPIGIVRGGSTGHSWVVQLTRRGKIACLSVALAEAGKITACGPVDHPYPLATASGYGEGRKRRTVIGIASLREGRTAEARLGSGGRRAIRLKSAGHFSLGGFLIAGRSPCIRHLVVRSASGAVVGAPSHGFCGEP